MKNIMVQMINKLAMTQTLICNELALEMQALNPGVGQYKERDRSVPFTTDMLDLT